MDKQLVVQSWTQRILGNWIKSSRTSSSVSGKSLSLGSFLIPCHGSPWPSHISLLSFFLLVLDLTLWFLIRIFHFIFDIWSRISSNFCSQGWPQTPNNLPASTPISACHHVYQYLNFWYLNIRCLEAKNVSKFWTENVSSHMFSPEGNYVKN